jgi:aryl-alcohol dehydrogenase-like predicted oxidoreductase
MEYRALGSTGISVSAIAFGAGPVPALMTSDSDTRQRHTVRAALDAGINWFDTAATYGDGRSETSLGQNLADLGAWDRVHLATKVRLSPEELGDIGNSVRRSVLASLQRLGVERVALLQLHNSVTRRRGDLHTSVTADEILAPGGILEAFRRLQDQGLVGHIGLTAIGHSDALCEVVQSGHFDTVQVPYSILHPSAGNAGLQESPCGPQQSSAGQSGAAPDIRSPVQPDAANSGSAPSSGSPPEPGAGCPRVPASEEGQPVASEPEGGQLDNVIADCVDQSMGVLAIRVFAGGALAGQPPGPHTLKTKFFPLELYQRDQQHCERLRQALGAGTDLKEIAVRFVLSHAGVSAAIIGFGAPNHVTDAGAYLAAGPLPATALQTIMASQPG